MDTRRVPRTIIDPKVRKVGFVTPGAPPPLPAPPRSDCLPTDAISSSPPAPELSVSVNSLSPVMIPPPRVPSAPVAVPFHLTNPVSPIRRDGIQVQIGSYNPSESIIGSSPMMSPSEMVDDRSEFSEEIAVSLAKKRELRIPSSSFPGSSGEMMTGKVSSSAVTSASVVKNFPNMSEKDGSSFINAANEINDGLKSSKQKTTKAERRAIQEAQRAAKAAAGGSKPHSSTIPTEAGKTKVVKPSQKKEGTQISSAVPAERKIVERPEKERKKDVPPPRMQFDDKHRVEKAKKHAVVNQLEARNRVELFRHLPQYVHGIQLPFLESNLFLKLESIHLSVYKVGLQYLSGHIIGGNARCIAMLLAFQEAIKDYTLPSEKALVRDLTAKITSYVSFLNGCRPLSISMGNAIRFLKSRISELPLSLSESEAKTRLKLDIDRFIKEKIVLADKVIVMHAVEKIRDGDVLLTFGSSSVVEMLLLHAHAIKRKFRVVVVDSRPKLEAQGFLRRLVSKGLNCTYTHINAISYIMHEVTRVFLGASSVLSNGTVYSRVGTACVAMVAHAFRVPVLICCEAYKFHERVQLDSICSNELGDPDVISKVPGRKDWNHLDDLANNENLQLLNLSYDATPSDYISVLITDYGMLPPTSVPVIVREYGRDKLWM